ncbi:hypothetical protein IAR55_003249 [Kwoniella newhampshirensis]|uniref:Uncharacterized protein n=1 Tax=Kwoniella newhampshirensis TaxID=1651941 RepID=A0AAW0YZ36_9TREE
MSSKAHTHPDSDSAIADTGLAPSKSSAESGETDRDACQLLRLVYSEEQADGFRETQTAYLRPDGSLPVGNTYSRVVWHRYTPDAFSMYTDMGATRRLYSVPETMKYNLPLSPRLDISKAIVSTAERSGLTTERWLSNDPIDRRV